jgi:hypothetical protein
VSLALIDIVVNVGIVTELISQEIALQRARTEKSNNLRWGKFTVIQVR